MSSPSLTKQQALKASGNLNARTKQVSHPLFERSDFFDPRDLVQLKYEALRSLQADDYSISRAASEFGFSRPTIYQAQSQFQKEGLEGLLPRKRGPKRAHKLTPKVLDYLREKAGAQPALKPKELARAVAERFQVQLHPRTIEKALNSPAKRGRSKSM